MPALVLSLILAMIVSESAFEAMTAQTRQTHQSQSVALGTSLLIVRKALQAYVAANPLAQGEIPLAELGLPQWVSIGHPVRTLVDNGHIYVYAPPPRAAADLSELLAQSPSGLIGVSRAGQLATPSFIPTISLPSTIPEGSIVLMR